MDCLTQEKLAGSGGVFLTRLISNGKRHFILPLPTFFFFFVSHGEVALRDKL
jgi:hypothetical protein